VPPEAAAPTGFFVPFNPNDYILVFISIILEALPFIIFGCILSGALEELLPQRFIQRFLPSNRFFAIVCSSFMGFILPMCECGIVPVMRRLLAKGMPASCAVTYMLSAPVINPIVLWSTMLAFSGFGEPYDFGSVKGLGMLLIRAAGAFVIAVTVGCIFERMTRKGIQVAKTDVKRVRLMETGESQQLVEEDLAGKELVQIGGVASITKPPHGEEGHVHDENCKHDHHHDHAHEHHHEHGHDHAHHHPPKRGFFARIVGIAEIALTDFLDIAAFLVIGAGLAALVRSVVANQALEQLGSYPVFPILLMMGFAFLLSLCSEADAFVAANFGKMSVGAKLGFLVMGPMLDVKLLIMYQWVFTKKAVAVLVVSLIGLSFLVGCAADLLCYLFLGHVGIVKS
jgi:uncharacterized membrane protein YraQ (UPF0718 family)